jgi:hypothetical protein
VSEWSTGQRSAKSIECKIELLRAISTPAVRPYSPQITFSCPSSSEIASPFLQAPGTRHAAVTAYHRHLEPIEQGHLARALLYVVEAAFRRAEMRQAGGRRGCSTGVWGRKGYYLRRVIWGRDAQITPRQQSALATARII